MVRRSPERRDDEVTDPEAHGPIDTLIIEFPADASGGETVAALVALLERGTVSVYDLVVVEKPGAGAAREVDLTDSPDAPLGAFAALADLRSGLLGDEDVAAASEVLEPGRVAIAMVYENTWAAPFAAAARGEGAELVASTRLTADEIMDALDAVEALD